VSAIFNEGPDEFNATGELELGKLRNSFRLLGHLYQPEVSLELKTRKIDD